MDAAINRICEAKITILCQPEHDFHCLSQMSHLGVRRDRKGNRLCSSITGFKYPPNTPRGVATALHGLQLEGASQAREPSRAARQ